MRDSFDLDMKMTDDLQDNIAVLCKKADAVIYDGYTDEDPDTMMQVILTAAICSAIEDVKEELLELKLELWKLA